MKVLYVSFLVVLADQISKFFVKGFSIPFLNLNFDGMPYGIRHKLPGSIVNLTFIENPGIAFGFELGTLFKFLLSIFSIAASIAIIFYLYRIKNEKLLFRLSLAFIIGGAVGNLIDRVLYGVIYGYAPLFYGKVVDFIEVKFIKFSFWGYTYDHFPVFNLADFSVFCGVIILLFFHKKLNLGTKQLSTYNSSMNIEPVDEINSL